VSGELQYSPDGRWIISGSVDKTIRIWDAETSAAVGKPLEGHSFSVWSVAYSPDGRHIISGSGDKTIRIWDAETGAAIGKPLEGHSWNVSSVAYSPNALREVLVVNFTFCGDFCGDFHYKSKSPQVLVVVFTIGLNHHKYLWRFSP